MNIWFFMCVITRNFRVSGHAAWLNWL